MLPEFQHNARRAVEVQYSRVIFQVLALEMTARSCNRLLDRVNKPRLALIEISSAGRGLFKTVLFDASNVASTVETPLQDNRKISQEKTCVTQTRPSL